MDAMRDGLNRIALLWAGLLLGGSIIAAPAKFQVEQLPLALALQVGRAQFYWVSIAEAIFIALALMMVVFDWRRRGPAAVHFVILIAVLIFAIQHLVLMPPLQARSERIIAGEKVDASSLHIVYVAAECIKMLMLVAVPIIKKRNP